jgi:hypothetical protein
MKKISLAALLALPLLAHASAMQFVAEASNYTLAYSLAIPNSSAFNLNAIPYSVDKHASIANGSFSRIAYYMELQRAGGELTYAYASMDAFTTDASKIGVPNALSGGFFQQTVSNMNVFSNAAGVVNGTGIGSGNIEFWQFDYSRNNSAGIPGATNSYDFGDSPDGAGMYGSMQIHNYGAQQTVMAYNNWGRGGSNADIGLGNYASGHPDWTFAYNAAGYTIKNLEVLVLADQGPGPKPVPEPAGLALFATGLLGIAAVRRRGRGRR